jgi:hypothetical protein
MGRMQASTDQAGSTGGTASPSMRGQTSGPPELRDPTGTPIVDIRNPNVHPPNCRKPGRLRAQDKRRSSVKMGVFGQVCGWFSRPKGSPEGLQGSAKTNPSSIPDSAESWRRRLAETNPSRLRRRPSPGKTNPISRETAEDKIQPVRRRRGLPPPGKDEPNFPGNGRSEIASVRRNPLILWRNRHDPSPCSRKRGVGTFDHRAFRMIARPLGSGRESLPDLTRSHAERGNE